MLKPDAMYISVSVLPWQADDVCHDESNASNGCISVAYISLIVCIYCSVDWIISGSLIEQTWMLEWICGSLIKQPRMNLSTMELIKQTRIVKLISGSLLKQARRLKLAIMDFWIAHLYIAHVNWGLHIFKQVAGGPLVDEFCLSSMFYVACQ